MDPSSLRPDRVLGDATMFCMGRRVLLAVLAGITAASALDLERIFIDRNHPAIGYAAQAGPNAATGLNARLQSGRRHLAFERTAGYLRSTLEALNVPIESQMMVFSKTSLQRAVISPGNPRSIFFNDSVAVGWVPGEPFVEVAVEDPQQGVIFYTLDQNPEIAPILTRQNGCLQCHESYSSLGVPGMIVRSVFPSASGTPIRQLGEFISDHRSPPKERWGGWYVTGKSGDLLHMGNRTFQTIDDADHFIKSPDLDSLEGKFDTSSYLAPYSDIVALMVFEHQMHLMNLLTRIGWEARLAAHEEHSEGSHRADKTALLRDAANELVDYLMFVDETPLSGRIRGTSGFAEAFSARGPVDSRGRSFRQLDLERRLMRYPCSYMIYSPAFDGLPREVREAVYRRMWQILSGLETPAKYARLSLADRQAVIEILRDTKKGLPNYFQAVRQ
jgi:hypothetical protein